jgi:ABC-2 type transport system ATP-binding protein
MNNDENNLLYDNNQIDSTSDFTNSNLDNSPILECRNLVKTYANSQALKGINLTINRGRIVGLLGPNGSGKSTLIKLANGLLTPSSGEILIGGNKPGVETKKIVSYLPERTYLNDWMKVSDIINFFKDFYDNFNPERAYTMLEKLNINPNDKLKTMSKGTKEKVQLILVMSRDADLYLLDEPIAGVDPAARDYILNTIITNYNENATIIISTHLISDIERILDDVVFISYGNIFLTKSVDEIRENEGKSVDTLFREVFRC